jgi:hypothetical protein
MYYSYIEIEYVATSVSPARTDLALKLLKTGPVADHLFKVQEESEAKPLLEEQAMAFHNTTMQLLFPSAHARHNIQPAAFHTTQVKSPDDDNLGKDK